MPQSKAASVPSPLKKSEELLEYSTRIEAASYPHYLRGFHLSSSISVVGIPGPSDMNCSLPLHSSCFITQQCERGRNWTSLHCWSPEVENPAFP